MNNHATRGKRLIAGVLAGALALSVSPILGFTGTASAADPLPPVADPIGAGNFCENAPTDSPFTDVQASDPSFEEIICLVATGLTQGTTPTTYSPNGTITRRQMALFITRLADLANEEELVELTDLPAYDGTSDFSDVATENADVQEAIGQLDQADIVGGFPDGTYRPGAPVSRRQMAAFINRTQDFLAGAPFSTTGDFFDDDNGDAGEDDLNALASVGIFQGDGAGNVFPGAALTRRQMANILLRHLQVNFAAGAIGTPFPAPGRITLTSYSVPQGSTISGNVEGASSVASISVTGCGFSNQDVTIDGNGDFELTVPASQAAGECTLDFTIRSLNGDIETQAIDLTVTAAPSASTGAPDLISASALALANTVTYVFDEEITSVAAGFFADFAIYNAAGARAEGVNAAILADGKSVVVSFSPLGAVTVGSATLAAVEIDAVEDSAGNINYAASSALTGTSSAAGVTSRPDLVQVGNIRTTAVNEQVADFTFDEAIACANPGAANPCLADSNVGQFQLVLNDGTVFDGLDTVGISANRQTISVVFGYTFLPGAVPLTQVDRGVAEDDAVTDTALNPNPLQAVEVLAGPLNPAGTTTDGADLLSARVAGTNNVEYTFDEPVDAFQLDFGGFGVVSSAGVTTAGTSAVRSATNSRVVTVTFPAGAVGTATIANVDDGTDNPVLGGPAVVDTVAPIVGGNNDDSVALQGVGTQAGRTALPDLVSVSKIQNQFGDWLITYKFDQEVGPALTLTPADLEFTVVDANGLISFSTTPGLIDPDDPTKVRISTNAGTVGPGVPAGFTNAQVAGAALGSVFDSVPGWAITEGAGIVATGF